MNTEVALQKKLIIVHAHYHDNSGVSGSAFQHFLGLIRGEMHEYEIVRDLKEKLRKALVPKDERHFGVIEYRPFVEPVSPEFEVVPA